LKDTTTQNLQRIGRIALPRDIVWGWSATETLGGFVTERRLSKVLIVTDPGIVKAGILESPLAVIERAGASAIVFDQVKAEPGFKTVSAAIDCGRESGVDAVVGVGGGSSLDVAKIVGVLLTHKSSIADCLGMGNMPGKGLPLALVPTTTGTGSEVTQVSVLTDESEGGAKRVAYDPALLADLVVVDPFLSMDLPPKITAITAIDALSHAIEPFVSNRRNLMADTFAREAIRRLSRYIRPAVLRGASCPEARYNLAIGATLAGLALGCGGAGATHALNYPLAVQFHLGHGDSIARLLPFVMRANVPSDPERYAVLANLMGVIDDGASVSERERAEASVTFIDDLCRDIGIQVGISDIVKDDKDFETWADIALQYSAHNIKNNPRLLCKGDIVEVYRNAYERIDQ